MDTPVKVLNSQTENEMIQKSKMVSKLRGSGIPDSEILDNLGIFLTRQNLSRINFMQNIYSQIINTHGNIFEFGVRWGQNLSLFSNFRGIYEPFNHNRKIVGFDTFSGFPSVNQLDGKKVEVGDYAVSKGWETELDEILSFHNQNAPIPHKKKFELVKGDATKTLKTYLEKNPETIIALAYFDFDLYEPTKKCLELILPYMTKGSIIAFDELNCSDYPGETIALREVLTMRDYKLNRDPNSPLTSYIVL